MKRFLILIILLLTAWSATAQQNQPSGTIVPVTTNTHYYRASDSTHYFFNGTTYKWWYPLSLQQANKLYAPLAGVATPFSLTAGYGLTGSTFNGGVARTWVVDTASATGLVSKTRLNATNFLISRVTGLQDSLSNKYSKSDADNRFAPNVNDLMPDGVNSSSGFVIDIDGNIANVGGNYKYRSFTNIIKPSTTYVLDGPMNTQGVRISYRDISNNVLGVNSVTTEVQSLDGKTYQIYRSTPIKFTTPANCVTILVNTVFADGVDNSSLFSLTEGTTDFDYYSSFTQWAGKTLMFLGDSMTELNLVQSKTAEKLKFTTYANGIGGALVTPGFEDIVGDATRRASFVERVRYTNLFTSDALVFYGGFNDYGYDAPIGTIDDVISPTFDASDHVVPASIVGATFYGSLKWVIEYWLDNYPSKKIFLITPHFIGTTDSLYTQQEEYSNAIIEVAKKYNLPVLDQFHSSGINSINQVSNTSDGVHFSDAGAEVQAKRFALFLNSGISENYSGNTLQSVTDKGNTTDNELIIQKSGVGINITNTTDADLVAELSVSGAATKFASFGSSISGLALRLNNLGRTLMGYTVDDGVNKLQVSGSIKAALNLGAADNVFRNEDLTGGIVKQVNFYNTAGNAYIYASGGNAGSTGLIGYYNALLAAYGNLALVPDGGNLLIGTTTDPGNAKLHVVGNISSTSAPTIGDHVVNKTCADATYAPIASPAFTGIVEYADNAAAIAGGLTVGKLYRTGDILKIVH